MTGRRPLFKLLLATVSLVLSVGLVEVLLAVFYGDVILPYRLRLYDPQVRSSPQADTERDRDTNRLLAEENYLEYGDRIPLQAVKNFHGSYSNGRRINTDAHGFRLTGTPIGDHVDVLFMGDSFTFGYNVADDESIPAYAQQILSERSDAIVANGGYVGGFSFDGAYVAYRHYLARLHPSVVIYGVFPNNDYDDIEGTKWSVVDAEGHPESFTRYNTIYLEDIYRVPVLRESRLAVGLAYAIEKALYGRETAEGDPPLWQKISTVVSAFARETRRNGAELVFVFYNEPNGSYAQRMVGRLARAGTDTSLDAYLATLAERNRRLQEILTAANVRWLDDGPVLDALKAGIRSRTPPPLVRPLDRAMPQLRDLFEEGRDDTLLAGPDGIHYSAITNRYLAQWLYQQVLAQRFGE